MRFGATHKDKSRNGVRGPRLLNGNFDLNANGWTLTPNASTLIWSGGRLAFSGGSANVGATAHQQVRLRSNEVCNVSFVVGTIGVGGATVLLRCDVLNHLGVVIATVVGPHGVTTTTPNFSGPGVTIRFTDVSTGNVASTDTTLDSVALNIIQPSHKFKGE